MNGIATVALLIFAAGQIYGTPLKHDCGATGWKGWKVKHGKIYDADPKGENFRNNAWAGACQLINAHNEKYAAGKETYYMALNHLADLTSDELLARRGALPIPSARRKKRSWPSQPTYTNTVDPSLLPASINWNGTIRVGPVMNQGNCGSCWAYSSVAAMEAAYAAKYGKFVKCSEQNIIDCANGAKYGYSSTAYSSGCNGGYVMSGYDYAMLVGLDSIAKYPDTNGTSGSCKYVSSGKVLNAAGWKYIAAGSEPALQQAVAQVGPVVVSVYAPSPQFDYYAGGVFNDTCVGAINHAVLAVGYGTMTSGQQYWVIRNSWGSSWGVNGFMYLLRGVDKCYVADSASFPTVV